MVKKCEHFLKGFMKLAYKHIKRYSILLVIRKIEIEAMRYHYTSIKTSQKKKRLDIPSVGRDAPKHCWCECKTA